jgi:hypothetical protein
MPLPRCRQISSHSSYYSSPHIMCRVLVELPRHLDAKAVDDISFVLSFLGSIHSLVTGHVTSLAHDRAGNLVLWHVDPSDSFGYSAQLLNYVRHCHYVFLGWAFPTALTKSADWRRYHFLISYGIFITTSSITRCSCRLACFQES